jgi:hypothetical protein
MSNIATGIGLSGKLQVDNSGQENRLAAAKAGAGERQRQQAAEAKKRDDLEKEVRKNLLVKSDLKTSYYNRDFNDRAASTMADIVAGMADDSMTTAQVYGKMQSFQNYKNNVTIADQSLYDGLSAVADDPNGFDSTGRYVLGGKEYTTAAEMLNDSYSSTDEGFAEMMGQLKGAEYQFYQATDEEFNSGMPRYNVGYAPIGVTTVQDMVEDVRKNKELFTVEKAYPEQASTIPGTNNVTMPIGRSINPNDVNSTSDNYMTQGGFLRGLERDAKMEYLRANPKATDSDFYASDDFKNYLENGSVRSKAALSSLEDLDRVSGTVPAPKAEKPTRFSQYYEMPERATEEILFANDTDKENNKGSSYRRANLKVKKKPTYRSYMPSETAERLMAEGTFQKTDRVATNVSPSGMASKGGQLYLVFDREKGGQIFEKIASAPFQEWTDRSFASRDEVFQVARMVQESSDLGIISGFIDEMGEQGISPLDRGEPKDVNVGVGVLRSEKGSDSKKRKWDSSKR